MDLSAHEHEEVGVIPESGANINSCGNDFDCRFKIFHELMPCRVREILLVSSLYDACIMEEDGRLSSKIVNEYRGLNLSHPPRLTWVSSAEEALDAIRHKKFDMVVTMLRLVDMDAFTLGREIKRECPNIPVVLLTHSAMPTQFDPKRHKTCGIDRMYVWNGTADILLALIKNEEDRRNVAHDTRMAGVRVILVVEDSPLYVSQMLPLLYKEVVTQVQRVMEEGLNEDHRILAMRARPKILVAENYEEAMEYYSLYRENILGVISDVRYPRGGESVADAGYHFLRHVREDHRDIALLMASNESSNRDVAKTVPARFIDKNSPSLSDEIHRFFIDNLGFGDFVFRMPNGTEIRRAGNFNAMERCLKTLPVESFYYHWQRNDFSQWLFARSEVILASILRPATDEDFAGDIESMHAFTLSNIRARRRARQKGVVVNFDHIDFDPETDFMKIGQGSLGGKARGLAFGQKLLQHHPEIRLMFLEQEIVLPKTLVVTTEMFDTFIRENGLKWLANVEVPDEEVVERFVKASLPAGLVRDLRAYLSEIDYPLAVRSSALFEDAQFQAYAGLYHTTMVPNDHEDIEVRLEHLLKAVKQVYASTYFRNPKSFARRVGHRTEDEKMAVIIQQVAGRRYDSLFFPAISGVAQSYNYYPFNKMKPEDGVATIAMGLGKTVVEGEKSLRFSPGRPDVRPQGNAVRDILQNAQQEFYALKLEGKREFDAMDLDSDTVKCDVQALDTKGPMAHLAGTFHRDEQEIRSSLSFPGPRVLTFDPVLKYDAFPLAMILAKLLDIGSQGMGSAVEVEFAVNLPEKKEEKPEFVFLQIRPMTDRKEFSEVEITKEEKKAAFCYSSCALGNVDGKPVEDIVFVKPSAFELESTREIAREVGRMNERLQSEGRKYLLVGPGRWGSSDPWLGIPVAWRDISGVSAIVETTHSLLNADPSQGSHFFHNITSLGINYICQLPTSEDFFDYHWLEQCPVVEEDRYTALVRLPSPAVLKVDGRRSTCAIFRTEASAP